MGAGEVGYLAIQAAQLYLEIAASSKNMTNEEAQERFAQVAKRVQDANIMWENAGK